MIKEIFISGAVGIFIGAVGSYLSRTKHKAEVITKTETVYEQLPGKVVYKDKVREIRLDCPAVKIADKKDSVSTTYVQSVNVSKPSVKISIYPNWYNLRDKSAHKVALEANYRGFGVELESTTDFKHITTGLNYSF